MLISTVINIFIISWPLLSFTDEHVNNSGEPIIPDFIIPKGAVSDGL
jgi:hypothetical protein